MTPKSDTVKLFMNVNLSNALLFFFTILLDFGSLKTTHTDKNVFSPHLVVGIDMAGPMSRGCSTNLGYMCRTVTCWP